MHAIIGHFVEKPHAVMQLAGDILPGNVRLFFIASLGEFMAAVSPLSSGLSMFQRRH